jgi:uncharacterized protein
MHIDFPFHFDARGRTAATDTDEHVRDMIVQLLLTAPGERVNRPGFGGGMERLVFASNSLALAGMVEMNLHTALQQYLADVVAVRELSVVSDDSRLTVVLTYTVLATGETRSMEQSVG